MKIGIVGLGIVGKAIAHLCVAERIEYAIYDPPLGYKDKDWVNGCDCAFIAVPTPLEATGLLDTKLVEENIYWLTVPIIIIKSTVNPEDTETWTRKTGKHIVVCPEFLGETTGHPHKSMATRRFMIIGGRREARKLAIRVFQHLYPATITLFECPSLEAELMKLAENTFLAMKVSLFWTFREICDAAGADYDTFREGLTLDDRIGKSHTFTYDYAPGWSGKCVPKDTAALVTVARTLGVDITLLQAIQNYNGALRKRKDVLRLPM